MRSKGILPVLLVCDQNFKGTPVTRTALALQTVVCAWHEILYVLVGPTQQRKHLNSGRLASRALHSGVCPYRGMQSSSLSPHVCVDWPALGRMKSKAARKGTYQRNQAQSTVPVSAGSSYRDQTEWSKLVSVEGEQTLTVRITPRRGSCRSASV